MTMGDVNALMKGSLEGTKKSLHVDEDGRLILDVNALRTLEDRLDSIETVLSLLLKQAELITGNLIKEEEL